MVHQSTGFLGILGILLAVLLVVPAAHADEEVPADERRALRRVLEALEAHPPRTAREYRVVFRELGLVGDSALPYLKALVRRYVDGPGLDDAHAHAFLGDRHFHHPIPEEITFRGHPFLETVEDANSKAWFREDEDMEWLRALAALGAMELHHERLAADHRYRAGDQVFANVAMDPHYANEELHFTWADPHAVVQVGPLPPPDDLQRTLDTLRTLYRRFLAEYGERFGLRDLMAPWGGRPDERAGTRSFPEGAPLTVFLYADHETFRRVAFRSRYRALPVVARQIEIWFSPAGALHVAGSERLGEAAVAQMLRWFARQESRWGRVQAGRDAISEGFAQWFARRVLGGDKRRLSRLRATALEFRERDRAYPVFPLQRLLSLTTDSEIAHYAQGEWQIPSFLGIQLYREQTWALVRMLQGEPYCEAFLEYLAAWLHRETQFGMNEQVYRRAFDLRDDDAWSAFDQAWHGYLTEEILRLEGAPEPAATDPAPLAPLVVQIGAGRRPGVDTTRVVLRDPGLGPRGLGGQELMEVVLDPLGPEASRQEREERLALLVHALDLPGKRPVLVRFVKSKLGLPSEEEVCFVLTGVWLAGYREITLEETPRPMERILLDTLRSLDARSPR